MKKIILPRFIYDLIQSLIDNIEPAIRNQHFGYLYTFGGLVILQQGCHDTGQCQSATVQRMAQMRFLIGSTITAFQPIGLIAFEIGYRADFQPTFLCGRIYFEIECYGRGKTHIAATQTQNMPR